MLAFILYFHPPLSSWTQAGRRAVPGQIERFHAGEKTGYFKKFRRLLCGGRVLKRGRGRAAEETTRTRRTNNVNTPPRRGRKVLVKSPSRTMPAPTRRGNKTRADTTGRRVKKTHPLSPRGGEPWAPPSPSVRIRSHAHLHTPHTGWASGLFFPVRASRPRLKPRPPVKRRIGAHASRTRLPASAAARLPRPVFSQISYLVQGLPWPSPRSPSLSRPGGSVPTLKLGAVSRSLKGLI